MKLSTGQILVIAGGVGLLVYVMNRRAAGEPLFGGLNPYRTLMPESMTPAQRAAYFARTSGYGDPSAAGTDGYGATSAQPAYAGLLPAIGTAVSGLFAKIAGPGNAAPASRPQASASSGGGVAQPTPGVGPGWTPIFDQSSVYFGEFNDSFGDFGDLAAYGSNYAPSVPYSMDEQIVSDQGTYDVGSGTWS